MPELAQEMMLAGLLVVAFFTVWILAHRKTVNPRTGVIRRLLLGRERGMSVTSLYFCIKSH